MTVTLSHSLRMLSKIHQTCLTMSVVLICDYSRLGECRMQLLFWSKICMNNMFKEIFNSKSRFQKKAFKIGIMFLWACVTYGVRTT